jgi:anti-sigma regulatory factor (Ser/Thr protein kinase)
MVQDSNRLGSRRPRLERRFPLDPKSAGAARQFVLDSEASAEDDVRFRLGTVVSEIVTNVILHARTAFVVSVSSDDENIHVEVSDLSDRLPVKRSYDELSVTGRGLHIVEAMTDRWGVRPGASGKTVWFEMARA